MQWCMKSCISVQNVCVFLCVCFVCVCVRVLCVCMCVCVCAVGGRGGIDLLLSFSLEGGGV